jgi:hypothetical protein
VILLSSIDAQGVGQLARKQQSNRNRLRDLALTVAADGMPPPGVPPAWTVLIMTGRPPTTPGASSTHGEHVYAPDLYSFEVTSWTAEALLGTERVCALLDLMS